MKGLKVFGLITAVFGLILFLIWAGGKRSYKWAPTFATNDDEPFGCELFDKMVSQSMGTRYVASRRVVPLRDLVKEEHDKSQGWLFVDYTMRLTAHETSLLLQLARRGDCVMVSSIEFGQYLCDSLNFNTLGGRRAASLEHAMSVNYYREPIAWTDSSKGYAQNLYETHKVLHEVTIEHADSLPGVVLARNTHFADGEPVALSFRVGKGEIIVVSTPLMLTNYGMLNGNGSEYIFRLLSRFGQRPVQRVLLKTQSRTREEDAFAMLDYFESQPPLWWAWCLTILLALLFMLTNARRRQRVIPIVTPPQNHSLEFVRLIGTLYAQQGNHIDLVEKKFHYTAERLRHELHVDITDPQEDHYAATVIAQNTNLTPDEAEQTIGEVRRLLDSHVGVSALQMHGYIDRLNALLPTLSR